MVQEHHAADGPNELRAGAHARTRWQALGKTSGKLRVRAFREKGKGGPLPGNSPPPGKISLCWSSKTLLQGKSVLVRAGKVGMEQERVGLGKWGESESNRDLIRENLSGDEGEIEGEGELNFDERSFSYLRMSFNSVRSRLGV